MEFLKWRCVTSNLAMGLLLGSTLLNASIVHATIPTSACTSKTALCSSYTAGGKESCTDKAQYGNSAQSTTTGWYPCKWNNQNQQCIASPKDNAFCSTYQCSPNPCSSHTNRRSCRSSAVTVNATTGAPCAYANLRCSGGDIHGPLVTCDTPLK